MNVLILVLEYWTQEKRETIETVPYTEITKSPFTTPTTETETSFTINSELH